MRISTAANSKALPSDVKVPNETTVKAMAAADRREGKRYRSAAALLKDLGIGRGLPKLAAPAPRR
jgi:antitoxin component of RelBE/YafQ-DinJ toxin-antitoxin module